MIMSSHVLDEFKESATELCIVGFGTCEMRRFSVNHGSRPQLYRGHVFLPNLVPKTKVEFVAHDHDAARFARAIIGVVHPDSVSIFKIDEAIGFQENVCGTDPLARGRASHSSASFPVQASRDSETVPLSDRSKETTSIVERPFAPRL